MKTLDPLAPGTFRWLAVAYLLGRIGLGLVPGYMPDLAAYTRWALAAAADLPAAYETTDVDYPPAYLYPLWVVGEAWIALEGPAPPRELLARPAWLLAIKCPPLVFDLALAALLWHLVARTGTWGARGSDPARAGRLAAALYLLNPAVLWNSGYWGQTDCAVALLVLAAAARAAAGAPGQAGALWCAATLTKPLGAPYGPLLVWWCVGRQRLAGAWRFAAGALLAGVLLTAPFLVTGRGPALVRRMTADLDAMPFTSVNAHNLWWILQPLGHADAPWIGGLTPKLAGLIAFGAAYLAILVGLSPAGGGHGTPPGEATARLSVSATAVACSFFFLSTLMHENHLFLAIPFLLAVAGRERGLARLAGLASLSVLVNEVLHDPALLAALPGSLRAASPLVAPWDREPYNWLQIAGGAANALVAGWLALAAWMRAADPRTPSA